MSNQPKPKSRGKRNANMGIVYVGSNRDSIIKALKIGSTEGKTRAALNGRMRQLYTTGMIYPLDVEYAKVVENYKEVEKQLHKVFADNRVKPKREFFKVKLDAIIAALDPYPGKVIAPDEDTPPEKVTSDDVEIDVDSLGAPHKKGTDWEGTYKIPIGSTLTFNADENITVKTSACGMVIYEGEIVNFNMLTKTLIKKYKLTGTDRPVDAKTRWLFEGITLHHRRLKIRRGKL